MANALQFMPYLEGEEMIVIQNIIQDMDDKQALLFSNVYGSRRKDPQTLLILALLGFVVIAGLHRFVLGQIGMGILYLLTGGLCWIGTIVDLVNIKRLALEYNRPVAQQAALMVKGNM